MKTKLYKWVSKVGLALLAASTLTGCADDNFVAPIHGDEITLSFAVADTPTATTRAGITDEYIDKITLLVYDSSNTLISKEDIDKNGSFTNNGVFTVKATMSDFRDATGNLTFYALANCSGLLTDINTTSTGKKSVADLKAVTDNLSGVYYTMSAKVTAKATDITSQTFVLHRNVSKWDIAKADDHTIEHKFDIKSFKVGKAFSNTYVLAAAENMNGVNLTTIEAGANETAYVAPNAQGNDTYVLINADCNDQNGWYKIIVKDCITDLTGDFSVKPNWYYKVRVKNVTGPGFATEGEAIAAAPANMEATVTEECPQIYSLTSTGTHTLGAPEYITLENTAEITYDILIKAICQEGSTCAIKTLPKTEVIDGNDWITIAGTATLKNDVTDSSPTEGKFYTQQLTIKPLVGGNERTGKVKITWGELTRVVEVRQTAIFNGQALGKFTISSKNDPSGTMTDVEYWSTFLETNVAGVNKEAMCGVIRNQGLHFPIGLQSAATDAGSTGTLTTYTYKLQNIKADYQGGDGYSISLKPESKFLGNLQVNDTKLTATNPKVTGTFDGSTSIEFSLDKASWDYIAEEDALIISVTKDGKTTNFTYDLYQTGFFYKPSADKHRYDGGTTTKRLYYEVIKTSVDGKDTYWLDRNIGATAAGMYIEDDNGHNDMTGATSPFVDGSQGGLYGISKNANESLDADLVPPGFRVPTATEFTRLTSSTMFKTVTDKAPGNSKSYWTSYFYDNASGRNIYFPKYRMKQSNGAKAGDGNTGYYWTRTQAVGASGSEVGHWWQAVKISGGSASIVRYRNIEDGQTNLTALSLRAVKNDDISETVETYKLNVMGYTHVYLYTIDGNGNRIPLNNWPGDQIATYNALNLTSVTDNNTGKITYSGNTFDYDYSSFMKYSKVYVILNQVDGTTVKKSWFNDPNYSTKTATPKSIGVAVGVGPWSTRVKLSPNVDPTDYKDNTIYYTIYFRRYVVSGDYTKLDIVYKDPDDKDQYGNPKEKSITKDAVTYSGNTAYQVVEFNTAATSIRVQPRGSTGSYALNRTEANGADRLWTINKQSEAMIVDFTINTYDSDGSVAQDKRSYYGKP